MNSDISLDPSAFSDQWATTGPSGGAAAPSSHADHLLQSIADPTSTGLESNLMEDNRHAAAVRQYSEAEEEGAPRRRGPAAIPQVPHINVPKVVDQVAVQVERAFRQFLENFQLEGTETACYPEAIQNLQQENRSTLVVDIGHLRDFDDILASTIISDYRRFAPYVNHALEQAVELYCPQYARFGNNGGSRNFFVAFSALPQQRGIRELQAELVGQLSTIKGTVTRTSIVRPELLYGTFQCNDCKEMYPDVQQQFAFTTPPKCLNPLCNNTDSWELITDKSKFIDWQKIRIQENASEIPAGSTPRSIDVIVRHEMCEKAKPGDICVFTGTLMAIPDVAQILLSGRHLNLQKASREMGRKKDTGGQGVSGLKTLGCRELAYRLVFLASNVQTSNDRYAHFFDENGEKGDFNRSDYIASLLTAEQRQAMMAMIDSPTLFQDLISSVAPTICGHERIKEGLLLQLLGGVHKTTPEGTNKLRGDLNVCIVGDPGLSKSQFLKYVTGFLPRSVYTSGKASSAAGLTASVIKDEETGDFTIEAGALMLADNGICCIDEFDKMDIKDQVAIHEAMEQQTISIAKAGIHATLNARTSILAAANPVGGRYDRSKTLKQNVNMSPPIMSRFDLFFVVLDHVDKDKDYQIARHILQVHRDLDAAIIPKYTVDELRRFVMFAKALRPRLTPEASELLVECYKNMRRTDSSGARRTGYRVTVRQLESLIRLSEAIARAHAEPDVKVEHVRMASRLLKSSMPQTDKGEVDLDDDENVYHVAHAHVAEPVAAPAEEASTESDVVNATPVPVQAAEPLPIVEHCRIKSTDYQRICHMVVSLLAERERQHRLQEAMKKTSIGASSTSMQDGDIEMDPAQAPAEQDDSKEYGMTMGAIMQWYLTQIEEDIETEEQYEQELKLIKKILKRMVRKERLLMAMDVLDENTLERMADYEDVPLKDDTLLVLHPSVDIETSADM